MLKDLSYVDVYASQDSRSIHLNKDFHKSISYVQSNSPINVSLLKKDTSPVYSKHLGKLNEERAKMKTLPIREKYLYSLWITNYKYKFGQYAIEVAEELIKNNVPAFIIKGPTYIELYVGLFYNKEDCNRMIDSIKKIPLKWKLKPVIVNRPDYYYKLAIFVKGYELSRITNFIQADMIINASMFKDVYDFCVDVGPNLKSFMADTYLAIKDSFYLIKGTFSGRTR